MQMLFNVRNAGWYIKMKINHFKLSSVENTVKCVESNLYSKIKHDFFLANDLQHQCVDNSS